MQCSMHYFIHPTLYIFGSGEERLIIYLAELPYPILPYPIRPIFLELFPKHKYRSMYKKSDPFCPILLLRS